MQPCGARNSRSLFNGRSPWYSALRQLLFGSLAASVSYGIGALLGTTVS
jgi:VIT1/CCC1 family predicted Fe2+/Mn2+ transporter